MFEKALQLSIPSRTLQAHKLNESNAECYCVPAFIKVISGLLADLIQIPEPHVSHQARVISLPLSPFCVYCLGSGLDVSISAVLTKR